MDKERNMNNEDKWILVYESLPALFLAVTLYSDYKSSINYNQNISLNTDVTVVYLSTWFWNSVSWVVPQVNYRIAFLAYMKMYPA